MMYAFTHSCKSKYQYVNSDGQKNVSYGYKFVINFSVFMKVYMIYDISKITIIYINIIIVYHRLL